MKERYALPTSSLSIGRTMALMYRRLAFILLMLLSSLLPFTGGVTDSSLVTTREMVVTAHPLATVAGEEILQLGGTAVDAMVAVQTVLGLVEPQSSGLGGGAFVVYYNYESNETITIDARERAPAAATPEMFTPFLEAGQVGFLQAWQSGLSVGVPGVPRLMEHMHSRFGSLSWNRLLDPAMSLAKEGFELTERTSNVASLLLGLNQAVFGFENCTEDERVFFRDPATFDYFCDAATCTAKPAGTRLTNLAYYDTLVDLANDGADAFYLGSIANDIVTAVQGDVSNVAGDMTMQDLEAYNVVEREPVCGEYRRHKVCGMGPPSSGGLAVGQILGMLEHIDYSTTALDPFDPLNEKAVHLFTQANRLAFADRDKYSADSDFVDVPVEGMLNKGYLQSRAGLIVDTDMGAASPGVPPGAVAPNETASDMRAKLSGTTHFSIVDRYGNALSMSSSIESPFGNGVMVDGFLLNNELTDFSFAPTDDDGVPIANRVEPNKRPRSSMSPTIVLDAETGRVKLLTGSTGGARIIGHTAQSISNVVEFKLDPQEAIDSPHYQNNNEESTIIETPIEGVTPQDYNATDLAESLIARGHEVSETEMNSGLSMILLQDDGSFVGGVDKRRDGTVGGSDDEDESPSEMTSTAAETLATSSDTAAYIVGALLFCAIFR